MGVPAVVRYAQTFSAGSDGWLARPTLAPSATYIGTTASGSSEVVDDPAGGSLPALGPDDWRGSLDFDVP